MDVCREEVRDREPLLSERPKEGTADRILVPVLSLVFLKNPEKHVHRRENTWYTCEGVRDLGCLIAILLTDAT